MTDDDEKWTPAFPGQRPPFAPGNEASMKNGTRSPRKIEELAARIDEDLAARAPWVLEYGPALTAYSRAEAVTRLIFREVMTGGVYDRRTKKLREGLLARLNAAENTAARLREQLGLTPRSEAQVARDRATAVSLAVDLDGLAARGKAALEAHSAHLAADDAARDRAEAEKTWNVDRTIEFAQDTQEERS